VTRNRISVVSITSGKGGVGKTNIAANLAYLLAGMKKKTLILDADCGLANIDLILGLTPKYNLYNVLKGEKTLKETLVSGPGGIKILPPRPGSRRCPASDRAEADPPGRIEQPSPPAGRDAHRYQRRDPTKNVMYFNMISRQILVVVTPEPTSMTDAYALIKVLYQRHAKKRFSAPGEHGQVPGGGQGGLFCAWPRPPTLPEPGHRTPGPCGYDAKPGQGGQTAEATRRAPSRFAGHPLPQGGGGKDPPRGTGPRSTPTS
jgi:hypothetical protein